MKKEDLDKILESHLNWIKGGGGERANLRGADLRGANLYGANLYGANLRESDLRGANLYGANLLGANLRESDLRGADLCESDLRGANLRGADLCESDLRGADLRGANLYGANLYGANLLGANLRGADWSIYTAFYPLQCPEKGAYTAFKKAQNKIVELVIPDDAKRSSATNRKCRASKAKVVSITSIAGNENFNEACSDYDENFVYKVGETVEVQDFNEDRWNECSTGIHHFITRDEAVKY